MLLLLTGTLSGLSYSIYSAISKSVLKNRFADPFLFLLMASRGVFIVLISLVMTRRGSLLLDEQSNAVYALRLATSLLIVFSIVLALKP